MNKQKIVSLAAFAILALGGVATGVMTLIPSVVHAQTPITNTKQAVTQIESGTEVPDAKEGVQGKDIPGAGHQDIGGSVDHQFEGVE